VPGVSNRRIVKGIARHISPPELIYERDEDGNMCALGESHAVELGDVIERLGQIVTEEWQTRRQILDSLDEPRPGQTVVGRDALNALVRKGEIYRDPAEDKKGATYRYSPHLSPPFL
jgi:hypothetical protein